jgi:iron complex outermembrane receptor protein
MRGLRLFSALALVLAPWVSHAREEVSDPEFDALLAQDIGELSVTSVSKRSQRLSETAAAIYVITKEDIRRAGIYSIPEALRLVPGMHVARIGTDRWAVASRGFNGALSNKLLVLIDGRAIYTPVFSGVYWGDQGTAINDIERIEVIRGPGASIYGANAVNGVINVITKSAEHTQGKLVSGVLTNSVTGNVEARHGGKFGKDDYYRVYGQHQDSDSWDRQRTGFRMDGTDDDDTKYTYQGDAYMGEQNFRSTLAIPTAPFTDVYTGEDKVYGGNVSGKWTQKLSGKSEVTLQAYLDHYTRKEFTADQSITTANVEFQNNIELNDRNHFVWGSSARLYYQNLKGSYWASFEPSRDYHGTLSAFVQNEYAAIPDELYLTTGMKFEYNDFTGLELQPTVRASWQFADNQTLWGAVSRAVRTPSIFEDSTNVLLATAAGAPVNEFRVFGNSDQESEELIAYEIGHRYQHNANLSFDTTAFYNDYAKLRTFVGPGVGFLGANGNTIVPYSIGNLGSGSVYGIEFATSWQATRDLKLSGSYTRLRMDLETDGGGILDLTEDNSPENQFAMQAYYNVTDSLYWDNMLYYVGHLGDSSVGNYVRYDTRLAYMIEPGLEVSIIGRNLGGSHTEFTSGGEIDRSFIGQVLWKF